MLHIAPEAPYLSELDVDRMLQALADTTAVSSTSSNAPATDTPNANGSEQPANSLAGQNDISGLPMFEPTTPQASLSAVPAMSVDSYLCAQAGAMLRLDSGAPGPANILPLPGPTYDHMALNGHHMTGFPPISADAPSSQWAGTDGNPDSHAGSYNEGNSFTQYRERPSSSRRDSPAVPTMLAHSSSGPGGVATAMLDGGGPGPMQRSRARGITFGVFEELQMRRALAAANGINMVNDTLPYPYPGPSPTYPGQPILTPSTSGSSHGGGDTLPPLHQSVGYSHHHGGGSMGAHGPRGPHGPTHRGSLQHSLSAGADPLLAGALGPLGLNDSACLLDGSIGARADCVSESGSGWPSDMDLGDDSAACSPCDTPSSSPPPYAQNDSHHPHHQPNHHHHQHTPRQSPLGRATRPSGTKPPRRYPRSHTCREPERAEFASDEEFDKAWQTWRAIRDCNNEAVRKSRNSKKAMLGCTNAACLHMLRDLKTSERTTELLVKAALTPYALTRAERKSYNRIIAARNPMAGGGAGAGTGAGPSACEGEGGEPERSYHRYGMAAEMVQCDANGVPLRKQLSASDLDLASL